MRDVIDIDWDHGKRRLVTRKGGTAYPIYQATGNCDEEKDGEVESAWDHGSTGDK